MSKLTLKRIITIVVGILFMVLGIIAAYFFSSHQTTPTNNIQQNAPTNIFPGKKSKASKPKSKDEEIDIEATFEDIEKIRNATDSWAGMNYQLRLYIKQLDENRDRLTPEQLERLHMYQQETPDWADVDQ